MDILGRYRLLRRLGQGGTGTVFVAADLLLGRTVALKRLQGDIDPGLLRREARSLAGLHHPNIVVLHDLIEDRGTPYLVLELVEGTDLASWLAGEERPGTEAAIRIFRRVATAVEHAHAHGVLHCDIKPSNVLLSNSGEVKLTDFTLARLRSQGMFRGAAGASIDFAAPEQMSGGPVDERTDVYGLGVLLQHLTAPSCTEDMAFSVGNDPCVVPPEGPATHGPRLADTVLDIAARATNSNPSDRFASVSDMLDVLPDVSDATRVVASSGYSDLTRVLPGRARPAARPSLWRRVGLAGLGLVAAFGAVFTGLTVFASPTATVRLPDLVATNASSAQLVARSLDLRYRVDRAYSSLAAKGVVISQAPRAGSTLRDRGMVTLVVSKGPRPVAVPSVGNLTQSAAVRQIEASGLKVAVGTEDTVAESSGIVIRQTPDAGVKLLPGGVVQITVSTTPWWWPF